MLKDSECTEDNYNDMLGALPPRAMTSNAFLVGEPDDHDGKDDRGIKGVPRYGLYFTDEGKYYYGGKTTLEEFLMFCIPKQDRPICAILGCQITGHNHSWQKREAKV